MMHTQTDDHKAGRAAIAPEWPGIVLSPAIVISASTAIVRSGMPELAVPFAAPTFITAGLTLTAASVRGGRVGRWWVPLISLAMFIVVAFALAVNSGDVPRGSYVWMLPLLLLFMTAITTIYWLIGVRSASRSTAHAAGPGAGATVAFWLLVIAAPVWTAILLTISVLDTVYEDVLTVPLLLSTSLGALVAVLGAGLAASWRRSSVMIGAVLLSAY